MGTEPETLSARIQQGESGGVERERMRAAVLIVVAVAVALIGLDWYRTREERPPLHGWVFVDYGPR